MIIADPARITELGDESDLPFVSWINYLALSSTILSSNRPVLTDGALTNAVTGTTYDFWLPDISSTTVSFVGQFATDRHVSFAAIVGHNLGTLGGTVRIQSSPDGSTWTDAGAGVHTPTDDSPIGFRMLDTGAVDQPYWRFYFEGLTAGDDLHVACLFMGRERIFPVGIYDGFSPPILPTEVQLQSNVSIGGNLLGSSVIASGTVLSAQFDHLSPTFVRSTIADFISDFNAGIGFWFAWRPETFVADLRYCWRNGATIVPVNAGGLDHMSITVQMRAYEG